MNKTVKAVLILVLVSAFLIYAYWFFYTRPARSGAVCIQIIATARNPITGEVKDFPTPCSVPIGWKITYH